MDATPHACAGLRSDPPMSFPSPMGDIPVASAAASPPLDPPAVREGFHGFLVRPWSVESVWMRRPMSGRFVRPIGIAPAASIRSTVGADTGAMASANIGTPFVVACPATSMFSLMVNGTPWNRPSGRPDRTAESALSAAASADSARTFTTAFTAGFTSAMRPRWLSTASRLVSDPDAIAAASSRAPMRHGSPGTAHTIL